MVYCGKASRSCENCRIKRIKCDLKRPGCSQCSRTDRICQGYRDLNELLFRDESQRITRKYWNVSEGRKSSDALASTKPRAHEKALTKSDTSSRDWQSTPQTFLRPPINDVAIGYLLGNYLPNSHFDYLPSLYASVDQSSLLRPVVLAVGLASLALQEARPDLEKDSDKLYVDAIAKTNCALQSPEAAQNDDALASVMLLSLFETLRSRRQVKVQAWDAHVQGALALVALRGTKQFQTKLGLQLFKQISLSVRVICVQHDTRVPPILREMSSTAKLSADPDDCSFDFATIYEDFADLRADMAENIITQPTEIITAAQSILQKLENISLSLSSPYDIETIWLTSPSPEVHENYYFTYKDHYIAQIWNTTWQAKVILNSLIYEQAIILADLHPSSLSPPHTSTLAEFSQKEAITAAHYICASVPTFFPLSNHDRSRSMLRSVAVGYFLIWPLFTAGSCELVPPSTREYVISRLEVIATELRIPQAKQAADMLSKDEILENWYADSWHMPILSG